MHDTPAAATTICRGGAGSFIFLVGDAGTMDGDSRAAMTR